MTHRYKTRPEDQQAGRSGKVENDSNKQGSQRPTQSNEGQRTPQSRSDRESRMGNNQGKSRRGTMQGSSSSRGNVRKAM